MNKIRAKEQQYSKCMPNPYFQFKQFTVYHDKCAMKVGTDGVLLGAWAGMVNAAKILDVGTGTALIALMLAQRFPSSSVRAVEMEVAALAQAKENIVNSPFAGRITLIDSSFQHFARQTRERFDLIVSNPPYFSASLLPSDKKRAQARHSVTLTLDELLFFSRSCLSECGVLSMILPYGKRDELETLCKKYAFAVNRETYVHPLPKALSNRVLVELTLQQPLQPVTHSLIIEESRHCYTDDFKALVREFYLHL